MKKKFPEGWDAERVSNVLAQHGLHMDADDQIDELDEEEGLEECSHAVLTVPRELLPEIRRLIARHKSH